MSAKHTPGPLKLRKGFFSGEIEIYAPDKKIKKPFYPTEMACVKINDHSKETVAQSRAYARLFVAAPDLLAVCQEIALFDVRLGAGLRDQLRAAIAKATGEESK